jgi:eukaryotic-like serine/threonine-protein kinase
MADWAFLCEERMSSEFAIPDINLEHPTKYTLVRCLGEGGMGSVYEAIQHGADGFEKRVAIKLVHNAVAQRPEFLRNFVGEAKLVAQLVHANIVQTYQLGHVPNGPFIAMELIQGTDLLQLLNVHASRDIRLPVSMAVFIASRICRGLAYAHTRTDIHGAPLGIVHRDISPQNIMISKEGDVKVTDFGMAKALNLMLDGEGEIVMGKICYMSPEQARGEKTDGRSDLFSVGIVLSEMLVGVNIFAAEKTQEIKMRVLELAIPDFRDLCSEIDADLSAILKRALARDPTDRYQSASALLVDLEKFIYSGGYGPTSETLAEYVREYLDVERPVRRSSHPTTLLKRESVPSEKEL